MYSLTKEILSRIDFYLPSEILHSHEPEFFGRELDYVAECISMKRVATGGRFLRQFEESIAEFTGASHVVGVVSATAGLQLGLSLLGVEAGDEVLVPSFSFVASANAIAYLGATPHFIDINEKTFGVDPEFLKSYLSQNTRIKSGECFNLATGRRIKAIMPVWAFGLPLEISKIVEIATSFGIEVIEDAAEALGSFCGKSHAGVSGKIGVLSFNGNKTITCGGGGALLVSDESLAKRARHLSSTAKIGQAWEWQHDEIGYNFRLPAINAAIGCAQIENLVAILEMKSKLAGFYKRTFADAEGFEFVEASTGSKWNNWLHLLKVSQQYTHSVPAVAEAANSQGIEIRTAWKPLHTLTPFLNCPRSELVVTQEVQNRILVLPSSPGIVHLIKDQSNRKLRYA